jgi:hypothetical protein|tara:strand:+ start:90 stop:521 length:432 start_codon:yes stop_codon:yes gene_type:complete
MKSNGFETVIAKYNVEPTSDLICSYYRETDITTRKTVLRTLIPVLSSLFTSRELVLITILKDSILFIPIASKSLTKRMFWNEIVDYDFKIMVKKKKFYDEVELSYSIDNKGTTLSFTKHKSKDSEYRMSENTLSFLLDKTNRL